MIDVRPINADRGDRRRTQRLTFDCLKILIVINRRFDIAAGANNGFLAMRTEKKGNQVRAKAKGEKKMISRDKKWRTRAPLPSGAITSALHAWSGLTIARQII